MRKVIFCTVVSLLVLGGMVATPFGVGMAEALTVAEAQDKLKAPGVEAMIIISANGKALPYGVGRTLMKPKGDDGKTEPQTKDPGKRADKGKGDRPFALRNELPAGPWKLRTILVVGDKTCMAFNGVYYCW